MQRNTVVPGIISRSLIYRENSVSAVLLRDALFVFLSISKSMFDYFYKLREITESDCVAIPLFTTCLIRILFSFRHPFLVRQQRNDSQVSLPAFQNIARSPISGGDSVSPVKSNTNSLLLPSNKITILSFSCSTDTRVHPVGMGISLNFIIICFNGSRIGNQATPG